MRERPILMTTESVKAILDDRKTMTRRVIKPQLPEGVDAFLWYAPEIPPEGKAPEGCWYEDENGIKFHCKCPYGQVGDRLWVRETCYKDTLGDWRYKAGDTLLPMTANYTGRDLIPSIFMPRWASRLTLEITGVRVERLQEITEYGAEDEGLQYHVEDFQPGCSYMVTAREKFQRLWDSLNAKRGYGWETNPWVWVIQFNNIGVRVK